MYTVSQPVVYSYSMSSARGLSHLKKNGFVHRDIKPGNILRVKDVDGRYIVINIVCVYVITPHEGYITFIITKPKGFSPRAR